MDREVIKLISSPGEIEEPAAAIHLDDALSTASQRGCSQAAGVGEGVEHDPAGGMLLQPGAQQARIQVEAGILVENEVKRVGYPALRNGGVRFTSQNDHAVLLSRVGGVAHFHEDALQPGQGFEKEILDGWQSHGRAGLVGDQRRCAEEIDGHIQAGFIKAVEKAQR